MPGKRAARAFSHQSCMIATGRFSAKRPVAVVPGLGAVTIARGRVASGGS